MTKLQVTIIDCIESIRCADNTYRLLITGIRNYKLKLPLQTYFDRQPPETWGMSGIVKVAKAQKNTDDINDYYLKSEGTNEQQNHTA